jgi:hypothetical protein
MSMGGRRVPGAATFRSQEMDVLEAGRDFGSGAP